MMDPHTAARLLGGEVSGQGILCPGPGHSARDRSLSVRFDPAAPGGFLTQSFAGDDPLVAKDHVRERLGLPAEFSAQADQRLRPAERNIASSSGALPKSGERTALALRIWGEARLPHGSPVERYLSRRRLSLPDAARDVVRFSPSCPFAGTRTRAMVALVRDVVTNEPVAIHRTALSLDGRKTEVNGKDRLALGPICRGAVKLDADEAVMLALGIGEGIESTLSLKGLPEFGDTPTWSLLHAPGIAAFPVLAGIECLWIAVDHDPAGIAASRQCADRWRQAGREIYLVKARAERADLNDVVRGAAHG